MISLVGKNISLVLGSGGARGLAHIGVIQAIEQKGGVIDEVVGSSMGALIGGIYATGELHQFVRWVTHLTDKDVFRLLDFTFSPTGWVKGDRIINEVKKMIPDEKIENLDISFAAVSTDLTGGCECVFREGSLFEAIRASIAIPGVFTAVNAAGRKMVDGGVLNPLPLNYVNKRDENIVISVNPEGVAKVSHDANSSFSSVMHSYYLMRGQIIKLSKELYPPDFSIDIPRDISSQWAYSKADYLIEKGRQLALKVFENNPINRRLGY